MRNLDLIELLKRLDPESEVSIEVSDTKNGTVEISYDIGFEVNENGELVLKTGI